MFKKIKKNITISTLFVNNIFSDFIPYTAGCTWTFKLKKLHFKTKVAC